jgi:hypothetical protein
VNPDPGLASWLQLALTPGVGPATFQRLLRQFGLPQAILERKRSELASFSTPAAVAALDSPAVAQAVARSLAWAEQPGHWIITLADETYPQPLLEIADPPALLYAQGRIELLARSALAIVGSRNATQQGEANAEALARALSATGLTIVSGLALGTMQRHTAAGSPPAPRSPCSAPESTWPIRAATLHSLRRLPSVVCCCPNFRSAPRRRRRTSRAATG